jgi:hypothetical protein
MFREPYIQIGDHVLTEAQASAVRCAIAHLHSEIAEDSEFKAALGPIADAYCARLNEVLAIIAGMTEEEEKRHVG